MYIFKRQDLPKHQVLGKVGDVLNFLSSKLNDEYLIRRFRKLNGLEGNIILIRRFRRLHGLEGNDFTVNEFIIVPGSFLLCVL